MDDGERASKKVQQRARDAGRERFGSRYKPQLGRGRQLPKVCSHKDRYSHDANFYKVNAAPSRNQCSCKGSSSDQEIEDQGAQRH